MSNQIFNTGILSKSYNSRGLVTHRADTRALVRSTDGVLWAAVRETLVGQYINIYRSIDNGFSWDKVWSDTFTSSVRITGIAGLNANGPRMSLQLFEKIDRLILWHSYYDTGTTKYNIEPFVFQASTMERITDDMPSNNAIVLDADELAVEVTYNEQVSFLTYVSFSNLAVKQYRPTYMTAAESTTAVATADYANVFSTVAHKDGYVDIACVAVAATYKIRYLRYTQKTQSFSTPVEIHDTGGTPIVCDMSMARDGYGTLFLVWGEENSTGTDINVKYSYSTNDGATWTVAQTLAKSAGHGKFTDTPTGQMSTRSTIIGGDSGFLFSYVHNNSSGIPRTFVRQVTRNNVGVYVVGDEEEIATNAADTDDAVVGLRWFHAPAHKLLDLADPGLIRVAYQIGEGNSTTQVDTKPVRFGQELLRESAYPSTLDSEADSYDTDGAQESAIIANFNIIGAPNENVDYYDLGFTGRITDRYLAAFQRVGTDMRLLQYEPVFDSEMSDQSAYEDAVEFSVRMVLESVSYEAPVASRGIEPYSAYIERDIRKAFIPPDFHLTRNIVLNKGNNLKRTVWTVAYDGNEYELSQVVPFVVNNQIAYYTANAYVVGPSNDPFAKSVLPSET